MREGERVREKKGKNNTYETKTLPVKMSLKVPEEEKTRYVKKHNSKKVYRMKLIVVK